MNTDSSERLRHSLMTGNLVEVALSKLREDGASVIDCILALHRVTGIAIGEAKKTVHFSKAWGDMQVDFDLLHDSLEASLEEPIDQ